MTAEAVLPYAGSSGYSGSETSKERADREDLDGTTTKRQKDVLAFIRVRGTYGATVKELRDALGWHHGKASAPLSVLHKTGHLVRLQQRRDRCQVYVLPRYRMDRPEAPHTQNNKPVISEDGKSITYQGVTYYRPEF